MKRKMAEGSAIFLCGSCFYVSLPFPNLFHQPAGIGIAGSVVGAAGGLWRV